MLVTYVFIIFVSRFMEIRNRLNPKSLALKLHNLCRFAFIKVAV